MSEKKAWAMNGFLGILTIIIAGGLGLYWMIQEQFIVVGILLFLAVLLITGITIVQPNNAYIAYSPEIAGAMLQRQQASAVISARRSVGHPMSFAV
jgi:hypothetical protein